MADCFGSEIEMVLHHYMTTIIVTNKLFQVAYTFDAGPNACLYLLEEEVPQVISLLHHFFFSDGVDCVTGLPYDSVDIDEVKKLCSKILAV